MELPYSEVPLLLEVRVALLVLVCLLCRNTLFANVPMDSLQTVEKANQIRIPEGVTGHFLLEWGAPQIVAAGKSIPLRYTNNTP